MYILSNVINHALQRTCRPRKFAIYSSQFFRRYADASTQPAVLESTQPLNNGKLLGHAEMIVDWFQNLLYESTKLGFNNSPKTFIDKFFHIHPMPATHN